MIELRNVSKWYGSFQVLTDCSTSIKKGEVVVICGPSGSGKSTLIKTINALEPFQAGDISMLMRCAKPMPPLSTVHCVSVMKRSGEKAAPLVRLIPNTLKHMIKI